MHPQKQPESPQAIGITGSGGFIALHLRARLLSLKIPFVCADRTTFANPVKLDAFVRSCSSLVHLAGANRGEGLEEANLSIAESLVASLKRTGAKPHLIFSSSTHCERDTPYGRGKKKSAALFEKFAAQQGFAFTNAILPHVFGEYGKPFYNSAVATFCHQLANGEPTKVENDAELELLHVQRVTETLLELIQNPVHGVVRLPGKKMRVSDLRDRLLDVQKTYAQNLLPRLTDAFGLDLFNTYRGFLFPSFYPRPIPLHTDNRGSLFEAVKGGSPGQTFLSTTHPGISRGNHFHLRKVERFVVLQGTATVRLRPVFSDVITSITLEGIKPSFLDIPTLHTHHIENTGSGELLTLFWSHELFDPIRSDTYAEPVKRAA